MVEFPWPRLNGEFKSSALKRQQVIYWHRLQPSANTSRKGKNVSKWGSNLAWLFIRLSYKSFWSMVYNYMLDPLWNYIYQPTSNEVQVRCRRRTPQAVRFTWSPINQFLCTTPNRDRPNSFTLLCSLVGKHLTWKDMIPNSGFILQFQITE